MRIITTILAALALVLPASAETAANKAEQHKQMVCINRGLLAPQAEWSLPQSKAAGTGQSTAPCWVKAPQTGPWTLMDGETYLSGKGPRYDAVVPGTVLTTLVAAGVYPDPYYGLNNMLIPEDLCRRDWWYVRELELSDEQLSSKSIEIVLNGVNYTGELWVNGSRLGQVRGAFSRGRFQIKDIAGRSNTVAVHILPPPNPGIPHEQSLRSGSGGNGGQLCMDGPTFICTEGWDWVPGIRDRNIGLWQDVEVVTGDGVRFGDVQVVTDLPLPRTDSAVITIAGDLVCDGSRKVTVTASVEGLNASCDCALNPGGNGFRLDITMDNPALWMPNGYGEQNLYTLELKAEENGKQLDSKSIRFGVREFEYELSIDTPTRNGLRINYNPTDLRAGRGIFDNRMLRKVEGDTEIPTLAKRVDENILTAIPDDGTAPYLVIKVNGVPILCRGGNWGMDDAMKKCSKENLEPYFKLHRHAGFNMVRNWTGESTQESFYELCDEYGMLVWNDFWLSTEGWNLDVNDEDLFMANVEEVLLRYRNHPSIAIWCPRNEGYAPKDLERRIADAVARLDGTRHYNPNSRYCNLRGSGPWSYYEDCRTYFDKLVRGFNTELGSPSIPTAESVRKFIAPEDRWPISDVWAYHDANFDRLTYERVMTQRYGTPKGLDDFCRKAQLMNYDSYRAMLEAAGANMWHSASGLLLWMTHPAWPSFEWQAYSWDGETFGSFYGCRKALEGLHVQMHPDGDVSVVNTTVHPRKGLAVEAAVYSLDGRRLGSEKKTLDAAANAVTACGLKAAKPSGVTIARMTLKDAKGNVLSLNDYIQSSDGTFTALDAQKAAISIKPGKDGRFTVKNTSRVAAIGVRFNVRNSATSEAVLPALFSDGCINLLPGESRTLKVSFTAPEGVATRITAEGYNLAD